MAEAPLKYDRFERSGPPLYQRPSFYAWTAILLIGTLLVLCITGL